MFKSIVKDVFAGLPDPGRLTAQSALIRSADVESALEVVAKERGLVAHRPWLEKCLHLFNVSQVNSGIIVLGSAGCGKSAVVEALVEALCSAPRGASRATNSRGLSRAQDFSETNHKLQRVFPLVVDNLDHVFGHLNQNHDWVDGVLTATWKKASRVGF